jgi:hypothetical protein
VRLGPEALLQDWHSTVPGLSLLLSHPLAFFVPQVPQAVSSGACE